KLSQVRHGNSLSPRERVGVRGKKPTSNQTLPICPRFFPETYFENRSRNHPPRSRRAFPRSRSARKPFSPNPLPTYSNLFGWGIRGRIWLTSRFPPSGLRHLTSAC